MKYEGGSNIPRHSADQTIQIHLVLCMMHVKDSIVPSETGIEILNLKLLWEMGCFTCSVLLLRSQGFGCLWVPEPRTNQLQEFRNAICVLHAVANRQGRIQ